MSNINITPMDILKGLGALAVLVPIITVVIQYRQSILLRADENFRNMVQKLSSQNREDRIAAASNMGTFIKAGYFGRKERFYDEAVDILTNRLSTELDYNVLNAIMGSLNKVEQKELVINKVLSINRNTFVQEYAIKKWNDDTIKELEDIEIKLREKENSFKDDKLKINEAIFNNLKEELNRKWAIRYEKEKDFKELQMHKQVTADFISVFLGEITKSYFLEGLEFNQNILNSTIITDIILNKSNIKRSALSSSYINGTKFDRTNIINTVFSFSDLTKSSFTNCKIEASLFDMAILRGVYFSDSEIIDVFFVGSDLTGARFTNIEMLKPIYFYKAKNIDKAIFDKTFKRELDDTFASISETEFKEYVKSSSLTKQRIEEILQTADKLK